MAKKTAKQEEPETKPETSALPPGMNSHSDVIREILETGVEKPLEIEKIAADKYKVTTNRGLINQVKSAWKRKKDGTAGIGLVGNGKKRGRKASLGSATKTANSTPDDTVRNGRPTEVELLRLALRAGGVDQLIEQINGLLK